MVNFCETAIFQQMYNELSHVIDYMKLHAYVDYYCNSANIIFSPNVELTTDLIILFANIAKKYNCNLNVSNCCSYLTFVFSYRL